MAYKTQSYQQVDAIGWRILEGLQKDARLSMAELGRRVGLSAPAVTERVRRLEDAGIITGYSAQIDLKSLGRNILAYIRVSAAGQVKDRVYKVVSAMPEVLECHRATGGACFIIKVAVEDMSHLERVSDAFADFGQLTTTIVLSTLIERKPVEPLPFPD